MQLRLKLRREGQEEIKSKWYKGNRNDLLDFLFYIDLSYTIIESNVALYSVP